MPRQARHEGLTLSPSKGEARVRSFAHRYETVVDRVIDDTAVAIAAINRKPVANARSQALAIPRADYIRKFRGLTEDVLEPAESARFLNLVQGLLDLPAEALADLTPVVPAERLEYARRDGRGIF